MARPTASMLIELGVCAQQTRWIGGGAQVEFLSNPKLNINASLSFIDAFEFTYQASGSRVKLGTRLNFYEAGLRKRKAKKAAAERRQACRLHS